MRNASATGVFHIVSNFSNLKIVSHERRLSSGVLKFPGELSLAPRNDVEDSSVMLSAWPVAYFSALPPLDAVFLSPFRA